jgi:hypothetical protein
MLVFENMTPLDISGLTGPPSALSRLQMIASTEKAPSRPTISAATVQYSTRYTRKTYV